MSVRAQLACTLSLSLVGTACVRTYEQPALSTPHAIAKLRVVYHDQPGRELDQRVTLNGLKTEIDPPRGTLTVPFSSALRVAPGALRVSFVAEFFHVAAHLVTEPVQVPDQANCTMPGTMTVNTLPICTRFHTEYRSRTVSDRITDAACGHELGVQTRAGEMYLVQYDFYGPARCRLTCSRQVDRGGAELALEPCADP